MAEYSREQRNQLSRAVANSGAGSRQLKRFVDNRHLSCNKSVQMSRNIIQLDAAKAVSYAKEATTVAQGLPPKDFDSYFTVAVDSNNFTVCGGYYMNTIRTKTPIIAGKTFLDRESGKHAEIKLAKGRDVKEIGVSRRICPDCLGSFNTDCSTLEDAAATDGTRIYKKPSWIYLV